MKGRVCQWCLVSAIFKTLCKEIPEAFVYLQEGEGSILDISRACKVFAAGRVKALRKCEKQENSWQGK